MVCFILSKKHHPWHNVMDCPCMINDRKGLYNNMRPQIKHVILPKPEASVCWICHVPQLNDIIHPQYVKGERRCRFQDRLSGLMFGLWMNEECRSRLEEFTGQQWKSIEEFGSWQGRKPNGEEH